MIMSTINTKDTLSKAMTRNEQSMLLRTTSQKISHGEATNSKNPNQEEEEEELYSPSAKADSDYVCNPNYKKNLIYLPYIIILDYI